MTHIRMNGTATDRTQRNYARLAGFLFLWLIATGLTAMFTTSNITGAGSFAEKAQSVVASERLYRLALWSELTETLSAALLGFALYVTLRPVDRLLAQLALYCRLGESFVGCVGVVFDFAELGAFTSSQPSGPLSGEQGQALATLTRHAGIATYNIAALCFSLGSILFFYLFWKSRYIPRMLSVLGLLASVMVPVMCFGSLVFPEYSTTLKYGWAPMALAEVTTGV